MINEDKAINEINVINKNNVIATNDFVEELIKNEELRSVSFGVAGFHDKKGIANVVYYGNITQSMAKEILESIMERMNDEQ